MLSLTSQGIKSYMLKSFLFIPQGGKSYEQIRSELNQENVGITLIQEEISKYSFDNKYSLDVLQGAVMPEGVDPTRKEVGVVHQLLWQKSSYQSVS